MRKPIWEVAQELRRTAAELRQASARLTAESAEVRARSARVRATISRRDADCSAGRCLARRLFRGSTIPARPPALHAEYRRLGHEALKRLWRLKLVTYETFVRAGDSHPSCDFYRRRALAADRLLRTLAQMPGLE
jgi:hypothetical protein